MTCSEFNNTHKYNLLGNLQLKIVSELNSEHAILKIFLVKHTSRPPIAFTQQSAQVPAPWPDHFRIASSDPALQVTVCTPMNKELNCVLCSNLLTQFLKFSYIGT